jgi:4-oxalocrotonate tautomerase
MPTITILQGPREADLKRRLLSRITDAFVDVYGVPPEAVQVWFHDVAPDSWGTGHKLTAD